MDVTVQIFTRPMTARGRAALEEADLRAQALGDLFVGTEHLLLGLLADPNSLAGRILLEHGVEADTVRAAIRNVRRPDHG